MAFKFWGVFFYFLLCFVREDDWKSVFFLLTTLLHCSRSSELRNKGLVRCQLLKKRTKRIIENQRCPEMSPLQRMCGCLMCDMI